MFSCCCGEVATSQESIEIPHDGVKAPAGASSAAGPPWESPPPQVQLSAPSSSLAAEPPAGVDAAEPLGGDVSSPKPRPLGESEAPPVGTGKKIIMHTTKKEPAQVAKPLTIPKTERARRTSVPLDAPVEEGVFLMYDHEKDTIFAQWSRIPLENALAWLKPLVQIPGHKYKMNGGKQVLYSNSQEENKYYQGWIKFITIANEYPAKMMLFDNFSASQAPDVQILQLINTPSSGGEHHEVAKPMLEYNKLVDLKNVRAVAVVPLSSTLIEIDKPLTPQKFLQMGKGEGDATAIQMKNI